MKNNIINGAALDVYEDEPNPSEKLCKLNNLICTPHIAGNSIESVIGMGLASINHLVKYFKNEKYKVAIIGYGIVGKRRHNFIEKHPLLETVAVCDVRVFRQKIPKWNWKYL